MQKLLVIFAITLALARCRYESPVGCTPYGVRIALGKNYFNKTDNETASIWFNTKLECSKSYITVEKDSSIKKIYCENKNVTFSNYSSFVHKCSINFIEKGNDFEYMTYGWTGNVSDPAIPFRNNNFNTHLL
jgi:hypothetical protein